MSKAISMLVHFGRIIERDGPRAFIFGSVILLTVWFSDWFPKAVGHPEFAPLLTCVYMILVFVAFAHFARRMLFHKIDIQAIALRAIEEKNLAAAVVFGAIMMVFVSIIFSLTSMLR